jgi:dTDP-4-dehydrorhamnose reductase
MNILIFGKDGQLGKAFQGVLQANAFNRIHRICYAARAQCDLSDEGVIGTFLQDNKPNLIINAAAYTAVDQAESEVDLAFAINAKAPAVMARYAAQEGATLLHYSTDYVFDGTKADPYLETDTCNPLSIYGKSKAAGEMAIEDAFKNQHHVQAQYAIFRTSWLYGNGDNFIRTILRLARERETLEVIANQYGVPTYATWLATVTLSVVLDQRNSLRSLPSGLYHAIPQGAVTRHELARYVVRVALNAGATLKVGPDQITPILAPEYRSPAPRPLNSRMDRSRLGLQMNRVVSDSGDVTKSELWQQPWEDPVAAYVRRLVFQKRIS